MTTRSQKHDRDTRRERTMNSRRVAVAAAVLVATASSSAVAAVPGLCSPCRAELFATCGGFLEGATFDANGGLWVVDLLSGKVFSVSNSGTCTERGNTAGQPNGAKFGPDGKLWIADKQRGLLRMEPSTGAITVIANSYRSEMLRGLNDLVFDAAGGVYVTEPYGSNALEPDGRLFYLPPGTGQRLQLVAEHMTFPNGVVVTRDGLNVLVGEYARKRITSLPAVGNPNDFDVPYVAAYTSRGIGPDGMMLTSEGILIAANFNAGEVLAFDPSFQLLGRIRIPGGPFVTNVAISGEYLYITEGSLGQIWRVRLNRLGRK
jgi:gluconolactonase